MDSSARNVTFWKAFAAEAGKCTTYPEVGSFLPRLHAVRYLIHAVERKDVHSLSWMQVPGRRGVQTAKVTSLFVAVAENYSYLHQDQMDEQSISSMEKRL